MERMVNHKSDCQTLKDRASLAVDLARAIAGQTVVENGVTVNVAHLYGAWVEYWQGGDQDLETCSCGAADDYVREERWAREEIDFVCSAGHAEYGDATYGGPSVIETLWSPHDEGIWDALEAASEVSEFERDEAARVLARGVLSTPEEPLVADLLGADYTWEWIVRVHGTRDDVNAWLTALLAELSGGPAGGDDDTYDYWPSGMRFAQEAAAHLGREAEAEELLAEALETSGHEAEELGL